MTFFVYMVCLVGIIQRGVCVWEMFTQFKVGEVSCSAPTGYRLRCEMSVFEEEQSEVGASDKEPFTTALILSPNGPYLKSVDIFMQNMCVLLQTQNSFSWK